MSRLRQAVVLCEAVGIVHKNSDVQSEPVYNLGIALTWANWMQLCANRICKSRGYYYVNKSTLWCMKEPRRLNSPATWVLRIYDLLQRVPTWGTNVQPTKGWAKKTQPTTEAAVMVSSSSFSDLERSYAVAGDI